METVEAYVTLSVHKGTNTSGKVIRFIRARFQTDDRHFLTAFNPTGVAKCELVKRVSRVTGKYRVQTRFPVLIHFQRNTVSDNEVVSKCELEPIPNTSTTVQTFKADELKYRAKADCILDFNGPIWAEEFPTIGFDQLAHVPIRIRNHDSKQGNWLIGMTASIILDTFPSVAKETHVVFFTPEDWDTLIANVHGWYRVVLHDAIVGYKEVERLKKLVNTVEHWDYGDEYGHEIGVWKEYYVGIVVDAASLEVSYELSFSKVNKVIEHDLSEYTSDKLVRDAENEQLANGLAHRTIEDIVRNVEYRCDSECSDNDRAYFYDREDDFPDWQEDSGWNDVYGSDVELSDIIEFRD